MPRRRLPRTDDQRTTALNACQAKYQVTAAPARLITPAQYATLEAALTPWHAAGEALAARLAAQTARTAECATAQHRCVQVNSHFIQVFNMAIERGLRPASDRAYYELPVSHAEVPAMTTVEDALLWAGKLAAGETKRVAAGGPPVAWPAIGDVNAAAANLRAAMAPQSTAKDAYDRGQEAVAAQRPAVDVLIKDLWNTVEYNLRADEPPSLRRKARKWGVAYAGAEPVAEESRTDEPAGP